MEPTDKKSNGALVGSIIIIIILVVGGIYIWQSKVRKAVDNGYQAEDTVPSDDTELEDLEQDAGGVDANIDLDINTIE